jgi:hypothetical protein
MVKRKAAAYILFSIIFIRSYSQHTFPFQKDIRWGFEQVTLAEGSEVTRILNSKDIVLNSNLVPQIVIQQEMPGNGEVTINIKTLRTSIIDATRLSPSIISRLDTGFTQAREFYSQNKKPGLILRVNGLRVNAQKEIEAITYIEGEIKIAPVLNKTVGSTNFVAHSILKDGGIYRLGIINSGLYKLDYSFLSSLGYPMNTIDPRNIHIYSKGGGMLPRSNSAFRYDDIPENAIMVKGEQDGKFDAGDYIVFFGKGQTVWNLQPNGKFYHTNNRFADTTYYFLKIDNQPGKRVGTKADPASAPNYTTSKGDEYYSHELDKVNY